MPPSTSAIVAHQPIELDADEVRRVAKELTPEPIRTHYVVIDGRRFPPKQVLAEVTGIDRSDFISTQARSILARLGFSVARLQPRRAVAAAAVQPDWVHERAEKLRPYVGRYVATDEEGNVIASAEDPLEVVAWLRRHARRAPGGLFKVPLDPTVDVGSFAW
jgi:hypothetical protein